MSQFSPEINHSLARADMQGTGRTRLFQGKTMTFARLLIASALVFAAGSAFAPAHAQDRAKDEGACGRDAARICKKVINDGDMAILGCLKENRTRLRPACVKHLQDNGQL
jgi:hypothetical protein